MEKKLIRHTLFWAIVLGLLFVGRAFALPCLRVNKYITLPKGTVEGRLDNGLRYIILPNELPSHNIEVKTTSEVVHISSNIVPLSELNTFHNARLLTILNGKE